MTTTAKSLRAFLGAAPSVALVEVAEAKGSTPREKGAWMLVSPQRIFGTIGGGQLEFMAIDAARALLSAAPHPYPLPVDDGERGASTLTPASFSPFTGRRSRQGDEGQLDSAEQNITLDIPLGPEIGQCCGGRVEIAIRNVDEKMRADLLAASETSDAARPHVYVFGGGHVGHALASAFSLLPINVVVVETRADALEGMPDNVVTRLTPMPEEMVREAPAGAAFVVLTHDHALDFLIVGEALKRDDAAYVGMIGSKTKKATFKSWFLKTTGGSEDVFARLVCPIGGDAVKDKRPAVIAALAAAEIMTALVSSAA
ncbi:xanthine dehydrogenase accessory protein XdhC [Aminobacter sp. AP02]|uniref:xanthine dehydrogenase accessory protein XdhC n=1 Tax=Aminobacter sp. AP02 TaxID=2135737 RepID=UPI000D6BC26D|nr:xanthine dehydrogenase accessory protein XdhC [Aminobacter sp. AP02]PWK65732.1 xanthine dehydrogenase accessory factor [Aminobacter sp. AP02]